MQMQDDWQVLKYSSGNGVSRRLARLKVIKGWVVREIFDDAKARVHTETLVFVPDDLHEWSIN